MCQKERTLFFIQLRRSVGAVVEDGACCHACRQVVLQFFPSCGHRNTSDPQKNMVGHCLHINTRYCGSFWRRDKFTCKLTSSNSKSTMLSSMCPSCRLTQLSTVPGMYCKVWQR